jgi:hypothetical protein
VFSGVVPAILDWRDRQLAAVVEIRVKSSGLRSVPYPCHYRRFDKIPGDLEIPTLTSPKVRLTWELAQGLQSPSSSAFRALPSLTFTPDPGNSKFAGYSTGHLPGYKWWRRCRDRRLTAERGSDGAYVSE